MLARGCRLCIRGSLYFLYWWVIPVGVHLSDRCTIAALSQCVMFSNRFVKWMETEDGTNNDALCLPAIRYINVPLIAARVCVCASQAQRVLMILCSALVPTLPFMCLRWLRFHSACQPNFMWSQVFSSAGWKWEKKKILPPWILYMKYYLEVMVGSLKVLHNTAEFEWGWICHSYILLHVWIKTPLLSVCSWPDPWGGNVSWSITFIHTEILHGLSWEFGTVETYKVPRGWILLLHARMALTFMISNI